MIIDLNGFKAVNDTLGHHVGDELLREVADRFARPPARGVTVARLGGDEFAVLVARPSDADAAMRSRAPAARRTRASPFVVGQERLHLSGSVGIALAPEHGTHRRRDLLKRADIAMYAAKNGADSAVVYRPDIDVNDPSLLSLMGELREAHRRPARSTSRSSRSSTCSPARLSRPRRWSAGTTRCAARCGPGCSCRSPSATG